MQIKRRHRQRTRTKERLRRAEQQLLDQQQREADAWELRFEQAQTRDGHRVEVAANLGNTAHTPDAVARGADGVGLLRTEFIFMAHPEAPDLETQVHEYRQAFAALDGRPLVARTLDVGGDKPLDYWPLPREDNPFLGMRGIRLSLSRPDILETQVRALLTAAGDRPLRIMFPMVKDVAEFRAARAIVDRVQADVPVADLQVGQKTDPIDLPNGVMAVMVCERSDPESNLPEPAQIRRQLENQRFEVLAQRYLRDLRQAAFIETRV